MAQIYINYGSLESWAGTISTANQRLLDDLHEIQRTIKGLEGEWESNSAVTIRSKIQGMEPRFQQYYDVIENYAKFLRNAANTIKGTENLNDMNAQEFI